MFQPACLKSVRPVADKITGAAEAIVRQALHRDATGSPIDHDTRFVEPVQSIGRPDHVRADRDIVEIPPSIVPPRIYWRDQRTWQADTAAAGPSLYHQRSVEHVCPGFIVAAVFIAIAFAIPRPAGDPVARPITEAYEAEVNRPTANGRPVPARKGARTIASGSVRRARIALIGNITGLRLEAAVRCRARAPALPIRRDATRISSATSTRLVLGRTPWIRLSYGDRVRAGLGRQADRQIHSAHGD